MRSLWIILGLLGLAIAGSLVWLLVGRGPGEPVDPPNAEMIAAVETPLLEVYTNLDAPDEPQRVEAVQDQVAEGAPQPGPETDTEEATLVVVARAEEGGAPLAGVRVLVWIEPPEEGFGIRVGETSTADFGTSPITDETGRAQVTVPPARSLRLRTRDDRNKSDPAVLLIDPLAPGETREIELQLATRADVHFVGRVIDDVTGAPLASALVTVGLAEELIRHTGETGSRDGEARAEARRRRRGSRSRASNNLLRIETDGAGYFEVSTCSWMGHVARVEAPGYAWTLIGLVGGNETRTTAHEVRLVRSAVVDILVVGPGRAPLSDTWVRLSTRSYQIAQSHGFLGSVFTFEPVVWEAQTQSDGRARIGGLPPKVPLDVEAEPPDGRVHRQSEQLLLQPGEVRKFEIAIGSGAVVIGWLREPSGTPADPTEIWMKARADHFGFRPYEREKVRIERSDAGGHFAFDDVPDGKWIVGPTPTGPFAPVTETVTVMDGLADQEVLLTAWEDLHIWGTVVDPGGSPCSAHVVAFSASSGSPTDGRSDRQGAFSLGPLAPGSYTLYALGMGSSGVSLADSDRVTVEAGASDVVLTLQEGASIAGRIVDAVTGDGVSAHVVLSLAQREEDWGGFVTSGSSKSGEFQFGGIDPGLYCLTASTSGGACGVLASVRVGAGDQVDSLILAVQPGARLRVQYDGISEYGQFQVIQDGFVVAADGVQRGMSATWIIPGGKVEVVCMEWSDEGTGLLRKRSRDITLAVGELGEIRFGPDEDQR